MAPNERSKAPHHRRTRRGTSWGRPLALRRTVPYSRTPSVRRNQWTPRFQEIFIRIIKGLLPTVLSTWCGGWRLTAVIQVTSCPVHRLRTDTVFHPAQEVTWSAELAPTKGTGGRRGCTIRIISTRCPAKTPRENNSTRTALIALFASCLMRRYLYQSVSQRDFDTLSPFHPNGGLTPQGSRPSPDACPRHRTSGLGARDNYDVMEIDGAAIGHYCI